jgi:hypothetical protein
MRWSSVRLVRSRLASQSPSASAVVFAFIGVLSSVGVDRDGDDAGEKKPPGLPGGFWGFAARRLGSGAALSIRRAVREPEGRKEERAARNHRRAM